VTPDPLGERLTRDLALLAARVDAPPPPLELLERRALGVGAPPREVLGRPGRRAGLGMAAALAGVAAAVAIALVAVPRDGGTDTVASSAAAPAVGPSALAAPATATRAFAVASAGAILGAGGTILSSTAPAGEPRWSSDGRLLAFQDATADSIHVVAADGSGEQVAWRGRIHAFAWSNAGPDLLAVEPDDGGLAIVSPDGHVRWVLPPGVAVESAAWRGADLSWTTEAPRAWIGVLPAGGVPVTLGPWPAPGADLILATWVGTDHLLAWVAGGGRDESQGLQLDDIGVNGTQITGADPLATTLVATTWVVPGPAGTPGAEQVLLVAGSGDLPWQDKQVERCDLVTDACSPLVDLGAAAVTLDPAWSPDGTRVAFVEAPAWGPPLTGTVADWYPTRRLWVVGADGDSPGPVPGASAGAAAPAWSADGEAIDYSTAAAVERIAAAGGTPAVVLASLTGGQGGAGPDGYGKGPWRSVAAWAPAA